MDVAQNEEGIGRKKEYGRAVTRKDKREKEYRREKETGNVKSQRAFMY